MNMDRSRSIPRAAKCPSVSVLKHAVLEVRAAEEYDPASNRVVRHHVAVAGRRAGDLRLGPCRAIPDHHQGRLRGTDEPVSKIVPYTQPINPS